VLVGVRVGVFVNGGGKGVAKATGGGLEGILRWLEQEMNKKDDIIKMKYFFMVFSPGNL